MTGRDRCTYTTQAPRFSGGGHLVAVVGGLVGPVDRHVDVGGLVLGELGELGTELGQMQGSHLLVQVLGEHVDVVLVSPCALLVPELELSDDLQNGQPSSGDCTLPAVGMHAKQNILVRKSFRKSCRWERSDSMEIQKPT